MKKSVIITIAIIYLLAVIVVGVLGVAMRVYNEKVYVTGINCLTTGYMINEDETKDYDGSIKITYEEGQDNIVNIKCQVVPDNANKNLEYIYDTGSTTFTVEKKADGSADVIFHKYGTANITVKATDSQGYSIKIKISAMPKGGL